MPGFSSWFKGLFTRTQATRGIDLQPSSRLLNPAHGKLGEHANATETLDKLEEHLFCWLLDVEPRQLNASSNNTSLVLGELGRRVHEQQIAELPRQPMTLPMLMSALSDENVDRSRLAKIILGDPALTDQLLQIANSPFFRAGEQQIESVDHAIFVLGLDGIRSVISAAIMRPMLAARSSNEALFAQRVWRWGLACARAGELIAKAQGNDSNAYFMVGLLPALSYMTIRREVQRIYRAHTTQADPEPAVLKAALQRYDWTLAQMLAATWSLPPRYSAHLLEAERPAPKRTHTPLNDGIILGTREVLRHAHQRNLPEDELQRLVQLSDGQFTQVREALVAMLKDNTR